MRLHWLLHDRVGWRGCRVVSGCSQYHRPHDTTVNVAAMLLLQLLLLLLLHGPEKGDREREEGKMQNYF